MKKSDRYLLKIMSIVSFLSAFVFFVTGGYLLAWYVTILGLFFTQEVYLDKNNKKNIKIVKNITTGHILLVCFIVVSVLMTIDIYIL